MRLYAWFGSEDEVNEVIANATEVQNMSANGSSAGGNKPVEKYKKGAVQLSVWENPLKLKDGSQIMSRSVTLQKSYKDKNDEWQQTSSLQERDIPDAQAVLSAYLQKQVKTE